jgi:hypothetical protein
LRSGVRTTQTWEPLARRLQFIMTRHVISHSIVGHSSRPPARSGETQVDLSVHKTACLVLCEGGGGGAARPPPESPTRFRGCSACAMQGQYSCCACYHAVHCGCRAGGSSAHAPPPARRLCSNSARAVRVLSRCNTLSHTHSLGCVRSRAVQELRVCA